MCAPLQLVHGLARAHSQRLIDNRNETRYYCPCGLTFRLLRLRLIPPTATPPPARPAPARCAESTRSPALGGSLQRACAAATRLPELAACVALATTAGGANCAAEPPVVSARCGALCANWLRSVNGFPVVAARGLYSRNRLSGVAALGLDCIDIRPPCWSAAATSSAQNLDVPTSGGCAGVRGLGAVGGRADA